MRRALLMMLIATATMLAGCPGHRAKDLPPSSTSVPESGAGAQSAGANANAAGAAGTGSEESPGPQEGALARRVVYFDFDSSEIKGDGTETVAAHAKYLAANSGVHVRLEGHTDERGSREYNIGLGERRAQAVRHSLLLQGVADGQISTVSYGAERPAVQGSDEAAWSKNRRVEIVYLK